MFDFSTATPQVLRAEVERTIIESDTLIDEAVAAERTWRDTMGPLRRVASLGARIQQPLFLAHAHPDPEVRATCWELDELYSKWAIGIGFRRDLYLSLRELDAAGLELDAEDRRLLDFELRDMRRDGHELPEAARAELQELKERLSELQIAFQGNLAEYEDFLTVTEADLDGLPQHFIDGLAKGDEPGTVKISMAYPDVFPVLDGAHSRTVRRDLTRKFHNRAVDANRPLLEEAVRLRLRIAELFGLPTWAHHRLEERMAGNPEAVSSFWDALIPPLTAKATGELEVLKGLLASEGQDDVVRRWDVRYLDNLQRRTDFGVDQDVVSEYFELDATMNGMLTLTGEVFGLHFAVVPDAPTWHPDAVLYSVSNAADGQTIGHFYADLFPRDGKFGHAAAWPILAGHDPGDGWVKPLTAFLCNFPKPTAGRPSLLKHSDVETLFHEFGHVLHMTLTRSRHPRFSGASTEWDFVEAPSQIMEHWTWQPEVLERFARHYATGEVIPADLVRQLVAARDLNVGITALRQVSYGKLDMGMHGVTEVPDLDQVEREAEAFSLIPPVEDVFFSASFGHLFGYDASYYGYMWAQVFGDDMFSIFEEQGLTSPEVGMRYRREVLEPNGTKDAIDLLRSFLQREPNNAAFLRHKGIGPGRPDAGR